MHAVKQPVIATAITDTADKGSKPDDLAQLLRFSMISLKSKRIAAVFLNADVSRTSNQVGDLVGKIMAECLERFVAHLGGRVVFVTDFCESNREEESSPDYLTVNIDGVPTQVLTGGYVFIELPAERVAIRIYRECRGREDVLALISVQSNLADSNFLDQWKSYTRHHNYLRGRTFFADGELVLQTRRYGWDDIVLPANVQTALATHVEGFLHSLPRLRTMGMKLRRGLIIAGPPGTGKTLLGKVLSSVLGVSFIWVLPRHVCSPQAFKDILELARLLSPSVLFLEDLDLFAEERETNRSPILGELMNQLDGASDNDGIVTIATTNRLAIIENALRNRPGRFDRVLDLGTPDATCRLRLLERLLINAHVDADVLTLLSEQTDGYTGAQLEELVNTIHLLSVESSEFTHLRIDSALIRRATEEMGTAIKKSIGFQ